MTAFFPHRRSALVAAQLLFSTVLLLAASNARAENITYNFVDYPVNEADYTTTGQDTISGWITTDGTTGQWTGDPMQHIVGGSLSWSGPRGSVTFPLAIVMSYAEAGRVSTASFYATNNQLQLLPGDTVYLATSTGEDDSYVWLYYNRDPQVGNDFYEGMADDYPAVSQMAFGESYPDSRRGPGSIGANDPWVIAAAVPEPGTLTLLALALLGLTGAVCLRRRRAKA
jgi:hypothetical protein